MAKVQGQPDSAEDDDAHELRMLRCAIDAFRVARVRVEQRWKDAAHLDDRELTEAMFAPLTEVVWWIVSIDEALETVPEYQSIRNSDADGKTAPAFRYARSHLGHHLVAAVRRTGGLEFPLFGGTGGLTFSRRLEWLDADALPDLGQLQTKVRPGYQANLAHRSVFDTFAQMECWQQRAWNRFVGP